MQRERIVIVGAGPAGVAAAVQCLRLGAVPRIIDRTGAAGGLVENAYCVENYPGLEKPMDGPALAGRLRAHLERFGLGVERAEVAAIIREDGAFRIEGGARAAFSRAVIVSSGTRPLRLGVPGEREHEGGLLFYEVRPLLRRQPRPRAVAVVGGGEAACDYALTLSAAGASVLMIVRSDRLKARGRLAEAVRRNAAVRVSFEAVCEGIRTSPPGVRLRGASGEAWESDADAVLAAVGRSGTAPALVGLADASPSAIEESFPGLFVAGDAGRGALGQVAMAVGDGVRAAAAAVSFVEGGT